MDSTASPMPESSSNVISIEEKRSAYVVTANVDLIRTISGTLGYAAAGLYSVLDTYCNSDKQAWPSEATLAETGRMSVKQVHRLLNELVAAGWVLREPRRNQFGWANGYLYTLPHHRTPSRKTGDIDGTSPGQGTGHDISQNDPRGNTKVTPKVSPSSLYNAHAPELDDGARARLSEFRKAYPTHRVRHNPAELAKLWAALSDDEQAQAIAGVRAWSADEEWRKDNGRYVPGIIKFVTEHGWECLPGGARVTPKRDLTQDDLRQKQYADWFPGTFQNVNEWYDRRDNGTLPVKGLMR